MAATFKLLATFDGTNGEYPEGAPVFDSAGNLYGVTYYGGANSGGTVYEIAAGTGQITTLHSFYDTTSAGYYPYATLSFDATGNLYGTTLYGGANKGGTVFELVGARHTFTTITDLYPTSQSGEYPASGVYLDTDGAIYGTTSEGGLNGTGTVFKIPATSSTLTEASFPQAALSPETSYGPYSISAPIRYGANLYGTTYGVATTANPGTIFSYNFQSATPTITTVATFDPTTTGYEANGGVIADSAGNLYGATSLGGAHGNGAIYEYVASTQTLKALAAFPAGGSTPPYVYGNLLMDGAGNLFGESYDDGASSAGTVFELKAGASAINVVYTFKGTPDGSGPAGGLTADKDGNLYGTAYDGGASSDGTVFELSNVGFVVCFATGTLIRTMRGDAIEDVAVEALRVGDFAMTASGAARPIRWIGHRTIDCDAHPAPHGVWPIRVAAHAFGDGLPSTDLFLSAGHSVRVGMMGDVLIPIGKLINGATIARHPVDEVTYWHVELDSHDVLIANNLPAESFLDCGNRFGLVEQEGDFDRLAAPHTPADFCLPFIDQGEALDAVRDLLAARAVRLGWTNTADMDMHLLVDGVRIDPDVDGEMARFVFPAAATSVVLASATYVPSELAALHDHRRLGVSLHGLEVDDGLSPRRMIGAGDALLAGRVHDEAGGAHHRFTTGRLDLPRELWAGCRSMAVLRVHHDPAGGRRWLTPSTAAATRRTAG